MLVEYDREIGLILQAEPNRAAQLLLDAYLQAARQGDADWFAAALAARLALMNAKSKFAR